MLNMGRERKGKGKGERRGEKRRGKEKRGERRRGEKRKRKGCQSYFLSEGEGREENLNLEGQSILETGIQKAALGIMKKPQGKAESREEGRREKKERQKNCKATAGKSRKKEEKDGDFPKSTTLRTQQAT